MKDTSVVIVIPIYKNTLTDGERLSLNRCMKIMENYPITFAQPESLDSSNISFDGKIKVERFPNKYFKTVFGYNELMLSDFFYERFLDSKYILIYQLDAFVFRDELLEWCGKGYDYIGAPWIASENSFFKKLIYLFASKKKKERRNIFYKVGNGGFSLRKTAKFHKIAQELKYEISENLKRDKDDFYIMEDIFWSITVPGAYPYFKIPSYEEALNFAIDRKPKRALALNENKLPFGCHGFDKPKVKKFWREILKSESLKGN